jgi:hypothetical protein
MEPALAEMVARSIAVWMESYAMAERNSEFWRGLLYQCADNLGPLRDEAYTDDCGGKHDSPLGLKIPHLVKKLNANVHY